MNQSGPGAPAQWWLDPAIAKLAFGHASKSPGADLPWDGGERLDLDLDDPEQCALGEFELLELIGEGGMGLVYRARQTRLQREVAVKLLSAGPWASPDFVARFQQEARHAAQLQHPAIVTVYEMGELDGLVYYAMQLVRGESLAQNLDRRGGKLEEREAATLMRAVAEAVAYAHSLGVLHLDLKPANILLDEQGEPRIADFGLARRIDPDAGLDNEHIAGTPSYMAPEQAIAGAKALSPATDVWGLGAILYELLSGHPPFEAADAGATLQLLKDGVVRQPSRFAPMSPDVEAICLKCLAKNPGERYPTARALADDLGRYLEGRSVSVRPLSGMQQAVRWARREPLLAATSGFALLALMMGIGATSLQWLRAENNATAASEQLWESRRETALRLEQDGKGWDALPRLLRNVKEQEQAGHGRAALLDRMRMGVLLGGGARLIDTVAIADANPLAIALSPDGSVLAVAGNDLSVRWYDAATLTERGRISLQGQVSSGGQARSIVLLRFIGNHRLRATLEWYANFVVPTDGDTWLLDLQRKTVVLPPVAPSDFSDANYSQDGRFALVRKADNRVQLWQVTPWKPLSEPVAAPGPLWDALPWMLSPDGRYAATLDAGMRELHLFDLPRLRYRQTLTLPKHAGISAWAGSRDGKALALGDREGRIFVLDVATGGLRSFPATRGREITWLGFSEDDAWLVAGGVDGNAHAFDVASGDSLVSGSMHHDFPIRRVDVDRAQRLLVVAGEGRTALWRIAAGSGSFALARPATRIGIGPAAHGQAGPYAIDWSLQAGLLASAGIDGQVRLWRLPLSPTPLATIPSQRPERLHGLNGRRLVDVAWNRLRLISPDGRAATPWLVLAQPPGYAELVDAGRTLIVTVGRQLHVYDAASWRLRFAPVTLPNTPQRLLVSPDSRRLLLSFGTSGRVGFADSLQLYDVANGKALRGHIELPGPLLALKFAADARRILAVGPGHHETTVLSSPALAVIGSYPNDPYQPVVDADFDANGRDVLLVTRAGDPRLGTDEFLIWDPKADRIRSRHPTGRARPYGIVALPHGAFVAAESHHMVYDGVDLRNILRQDVTSDSAVGVIAASRDGHLVAVASQHAVQLYTADGALIGNPLPVDAPPTDGIAEIAFSDDGQALLARTIWRWQFWPIKAERRPAGQLDTLIARLSVDSEHPQRLIMPSVSERASLRRNDPGAWPALEPRPVPPMAGYGSIDQSPIPNRSANTPAWLMDMTPVYTVGPESVRNSNGTIRPFLRPYPAGVQRFSGIEYDLRGMSEVGQAGFGGGAKCLQMPDGLLVTAVHALLVPVVRTPEAGPITLAEMILHYRDGGSARVPIRTTLEVQGYGANDSAVRQVFSPKLPRSVGFQAEVLAAPRLANPEPKRPVRCVDLRTTGYPMLVLGLTLEPLAPPAPVVISGRNSR